MYYPGHVGAVGGLVGMIGGLGGFVLPIVFGAALDLTGIYTSCFAILAGLVVIMLRITSYNVCYTKLLREPTNALVLFGIIILVCILASGLGIRAALKVDPATALGG